MRYCTLLLLCLSLTASGQDTSFANRLHGAELRHDTASMLDLIERLPLDQTATEADISHSARIAAQLKNEELYVALENLKKSRFPHGTWTKNGYYKRIHAESDTSKIAALVAEYFHYFPEDAYHLLGDSGRYGAFILSIAVASCQRNHYYRQALDIIKWCKDNAYTAVLQNYVVSWELEDDTNLVEATALAKATFDTTHASSRDYQEYADTYAFALYRDGDYKQAWVYAKAALAQAGRDVGIYRHYCLIAEKNERRKVVVDSLSNFIRRGHSDSAMQAQLVRLWDERHRGQGQRELATLLAAAPKAREVDLITAALNEPASDFTLTDINGNRVTLSSFRGKTVVLDFWATWCGPCKASFPAMQQVVDHHKSDTSVAILFIDTWEKEKDKFRNAQDFMKTQPYTFHVLVDTGNVVILRYGISAIPAKFVIDRSGVLRYKETGYDGNFNKTVAKLEEMIDLAAKR